MMYALSYVLKCSLIFFFWRYMHESENSRAKNCQMFFKEMESCVYLYNDKNKIIITHNQKQNDWIITTLTKDVKIVE